MRSVVSVGSSICSLRTEFLSEHTVFGTLKIAQQALDDWVDYYNTCRSQRSFEDGHPPLNGSPPWTQARWTATLVTCSRHGQGLRWLARWVDHDGNERSKAFARKAMAQAHVAEVTAALTTGVCRPEEGHSYLAGVAKLGRNV